MIPGSDDGVREIIVPEASDGQRIDLFLTQVCDGYSRSQIRQAVQEDGCEVDGRVIRPSYRIRAGQKIRFRLPAPPSDDTIPENISLDILYEDDGLIVVNKPAGMVVHPARGNWTGTLTSALAFRFRSLSDVGGPTRPGIIHRLDRDTSGVIVVAKTNAVHMDLADQFHDRHVEKEYFAITAGRIDRDRDLIEAPIGRHPYQRDKQAIRAGDRTSKAASTFYEVIARHGRFTQVRVLPKTGRTHQIRVHLAHIGAPILCDRLYAGHSELHRSALFGHADGSVGLADGRAGPAAGSSGQGGGRLGPPNRSDDPVILQRQALHARRLTFRHPQSGKPMAFEAPLPPDLQRVIDLLSATTVTSAAREG